MAKELNNTAKMVRILTRLKTEKNGAVVDSMRDKGITYSLSYGVSVPLIREVAVAYSPDHSLARFLYVQDVRELKLASFSIADPDAVTVDEFAFWASGVENSEVAEHLGTVLLSKIPTVAGLVELWLASGNELLAYSALMAGGAAISRNKNLSGMDLGKCIGIISDTGNGIVTSRQRYLWHGLSVFLMNVLQWIPDSKSIVGGLLEHIMSEKYLCAEYLNAEIGWLLK